MGRIIAARVKSPVCGGAVGHNVAMFRWRRINAGGVAILGMVILGVAVLSVRGLWPSSDNGDDLTTSEAAAAPLVVDPADPESLNVETQRLYRISPDGGSRAVYSISESLGGLSRSFEGSTAAIAGEIVIDTADLAASRVGEIVVNVETLESSSMLRDRRIHRDYLQSSRWPFVRFKPVSVVGLGAGFVDGAVYDVTVTGELTVKDTTRAETFTGIVVVTDHTLTAEMAATVLGSDYGIEPIDIGPINIARLMRTADEITLTFAVAAQRVDLGSAPVGELRRTIPDTVMPYGEFAAVVQPILERRCVHCHSPGGSGFSTVALDTAASAAIFASDIAFVTGIGYMPPWPLSDASVQMRNDWSLTDDEKAELRRWAAAGGGLDVAADTALIGDTPAGLAIEQDQVLAPRDGPYSSYSTADGEPLRPDDYRCQVHEVADPESDGTWIKGIDFVPGQSSVVHHALIFHAPAAALPEIEARIAQDDADEAANQLPAQPGWACFGLTGLGTPGVRDIHGWGRGGQPLIYPDGYGIYLAAGDVLIKQVHYHYSHEPLSDASTIVLDTATAQEARLMQQIRLATYLTPAEIPCTPEQAALSASRAAAGGHRDMCVRDNVLADILTRYGAFATAIPYALIQICGGTVDDYDDLTGTVNHSSCDLGVRHPGTLHTLFGHMHELGKSYRLTLNPDTPQQRVLVDIPAWDFQWQLFYQPVADIAVTNSDVFRIECWWDRSYRQTDDPYYVVWNEGADEEMCYTIIWTMPD